MKEEDLKKIPQFSIPFSPLRLAKNDEGDLRVFDVLRKKWVVLTPEEFVRQNFVNWLIKSKQYPASLIQNEVPITVNNTLKRCDTIAYDREGNPLLIVEYKAPNVEINQEVFDQIYRYNLALKARYLIVSNGVKHYCCRIDYKNATYNFIRVVPTFHEAIDLPMEN